MIDVFFSNTTGEDRKDMEEKLLSLFKSDCSDRLLRQLHHGVILVAWFSSRSWFRTSAIDLLKQAFQTEKLPSQILKKGEYAGWKRDAVSKFALAAWLWQGALSKMKTALQSLHSNEQVDRNSLNLADFTPPLTNSCLRRPCVWETAKIRDIWPLFRAFTTRMAGWPCGARP